MKTKKCILCGTQHSNKSIENLNVLSETCFRCAFMVSSLEVCVKALNSFVQTGEVRPRRKLTIEEFKIEKI